MAGRVAPGEGPVEAPAQGKIYWVRGALGLVPFRVRKNDGIRAEAENGDVWITFKKKGKRWFYEGFMGRQNVSVEIVRRQ